MSAIRQDAWSDEDDLILAEVTLRHIREGSTQLSAFEEVGERIGRTAAACGFRWNSFVRKKYEAAIQIAKAQRQKRTQLKKHAPFRFPVLLPLVYWMVQSCLRAKKKYSQKKHYRLMQ